MKMKARKGRTAWAAGAVMVAMLGLGAVACEDEPDKSGVSREDASRTRNQNDLIAKQPAHKVKHSPGRDTKNAWIDTWGQEQGKLAYVYIQNGNGQYGYFVFVGPPVSYCTSLVPPYTKTGIDVYQSGQQQAIVPAPGMDGLYSSSSNCNVYYGIDAVSGKYVEFSIGMNQSYILFSEPSTLPMYKSAAQMGPSSIEAAKKKD